MYVESVGEEDRRVAADTRQDIRVNPGLDHVGREKGNQPGSFGRLFEGLNRKAVIFRPGPGLAFGTQSHCHFITRITQVQGMGASLAAIAQDGDSFTAERLRIGVRFFKQFHCFVLSDSSTVRNCLRDKKNPATFRVRGLFRFSSLRQTPAPAAAKQHGKEQGLAHFVHLSQGSGSRWGIIRQ